MTIPQVRLGELLLQQQLCSRAALVQAWDAKVAYGDRLGTNLLSLGLLSEAKLTEALALQQQVPVATLDAMQPAWLQGVLSALPRDVLLRERVFPTGVSATGAVVFACVDPLQASWAAALAPSLRGRGVVATISCEARMWDLHERFLHHRSSMRRNPLRVLAAPRQEPVRPAPQVRQLRQEMANDVDGPGPELTSEEDFRSLYGNLHQRDEDDRQGPRLGPGQVPAPIGALPPTQGDEGLPFMVVPTPAVADPLVAVVPVSPAEPAIEELALREVAADALPPSDPSEEFFPAGGRYAEFPEGAPGGKESLPSGESAIDFDVARAAIAAALSRDKVAMAMLRAARRRFARAAMVMVHPDRVLGWMGLGDGMADVGAFALPRQQPSVFQVVAESRAHFVGGLSRQVGHGTWVKATGKRIPLSIAALPVLLRGEVVHILVVDNGHQQQVAATELAELLLLAQDAATRYDALLIDNA